MYVCICHALNDKKVKAALDKGATNPASVFRHHQCQVKCGKCVPMMRSMAAEHQAVLAQQAACHPTPVPEPANADAVPAALPVYAVAAE
ncbi:(2Fe-2S)-binding protein [Azospirillum picis]|uniref:Bacterioferritin-associated ferredoxin n=1 Tax=Azospirillum picis TaxID=488438 RepID=A0ABU0MTE9_9PROT|nr:(2Fe-2S)-binding protein [Azospirillum picis]MBP2303016.1 bacterioferritin-associated ferredoxin [Azospirillum picis]MDQ0536768.1 bacterioferritin-associated ferredoxin [Azospirillum picis]